jgi:two-component system chemotaxis response regulator CheB
LKTGIKYKAVVIGASAGGLLTLSSLLEKLPADYTLPVIIVQHRSKEPIGLLEELLQTKCKIRVKQADEKEQIEKSIVYLAPPDYHLLIEQDLTFSLTVDEPVRFSRPSIDVLFQSAAFVFKELLIGIVLTGSNSDGIAGVQAISDNHGLVIAQDPREAPFPEMPLASILSGKVTHVFSLDQIVAFLLSLHTEADEQKA